jgi:hypothetical protein
MHATDIVGYTYAVEQYTLAGVIEAMIADGSASPAARDMDTEAVLTQIAEANGIDRFDESSFDSGDFPKVIFASDVEDGELFLDSDGEYVEV